METSINTTSKGLSEKAAIASSPVFANSTLYPADESIVSSTSRMISSSSHTSTEPFLLINFQYNLKYLEQRNVRASLVLFKLISNGDLRQVRSTLRFIFRTARAFRPFAKPPRGVVTSA